MRLINEFVEKLRERLGEYEYSHLVEHDTEECLHCRENEDDWCNCRNCFICVWDKAKAIVKELEEEYKDVPDTNVGKWIPVSERLPEKYIPVLVMLNNKQMCVFTLETDFEDDLKVYWADWYDYPKKISETIAWQPLPEPYKG